MIMGTCFKWDFRIMFNGKLRKFYMWRKDGGFS